MESLEQVLEANLKAEERSAAALDQENSKLQELTELLTAGSLGSSGGTLTTSNLAMTGTAARLQTEVLKGYGRDRRGP